MTLFLRFTVKPVKLCLTWLLPSLAGAVTLLSPWRHGAVWTMAWRQPRPAPTHVFFSTRLGSALLAESREFAKIQKGFSFFTLWLTVRRNLIEIHGSAWSPRFHSSGAGAKKSWTRAFNSEIAPMLQSQVLTNVFTLAQSVLPRVVNFDRCAKSGWRPGLCITAFSTFGMSICICVNAG